MHRILAKSASIARRITQTRRNTSTTTSECRDIGNVMRQLETDSGPTPEQQGVGLMAPEVDMLRQRVHSSAWVKQLISGARHCTFSQLTKPKDLLLRAKQKQIAQKGTRRTRYSNILGIDELQNSSVDVGKSQYLPATAIGIFVAATDQTTWRMLSETGWVRPDIVEHCSRVLRLRIISDMHRACCDYVAHAADRVRLEQQLTIPAKGTTFKVEPSRLDVIRMDVTRRIALQDALWQLPSACPFVDLSHECTNINNSIISIDKTVLPAAGLQCIIEIPAAYTSSSTFQLPVSSESSARAIWTELRRIAGNTGENSSEIAADILAERRWPAFRLTGRPQSLDIPTLGTCALESLYALLPQLTPELMHIKTQTSGPSTLPFSTFNTLSKRSKKKHKQEMELAIANYLKEATQPTENQQLQKLHRDVSIAFKYSLVRPGSPFAPADGLATKKVPLYRASEIFGHAIAATVVPWLLHLPLSSTDENTSQSPRYVGIVALPCTTQLAAQFHRHAAYIKEI